MIRKHHCVACGSYIENSEYHSQIYGNYCRECCIRAEKLSKAKASINYLSKKITSAKVKGKKFVCYKKEMVKIKKIENILKDEKKYLERLIKSAPQYYEGKI